MVCTQRPVLLETETGLVTQFAKTLSTLYLIRHEYENCRYRYGRIGRVDDSDGTGAAQHSNANATFSEWYWVCGGGVYVLHAQALSLFFRLPFFVNAIRP